MKPNLSSKVMKLAPNDNYFTEEQHTYAYIKVINKFEKKNFF